MGGDKKGTEAAEAVAAAPVALPAEVMARVDALQKIQDERDELEDKHDAELRELESKYLELYKGTYDKRRDIVTGATEAEGVAADAAVKGIPKFWLVAMQNHHEVAQFIEETDVPALEYLEDVTVSYLEKLRGFSLHFRFRSNPYFDNEVLSKEYQLPGELPGSEEDEEEEGGEEQDGQEDDSPLEGVKKIVGTEILWKSGKNLCMKSVAKKVKGGRGKPKKTVQRMEEVPSFFRFFDSPDMKIDESMEAEQAMELVNQIQADISVAQAIRDDLLPEAVRWFTGEAVEEEDYDEDEDDDEDHDEDEDEEDDAPPPRAGRGRGGRGGRGKPKKDEDDDEENEEGDAAEIQKALADSFNKKVQLGDKGAPGGKKEEECKQQ